MDENEVVAFVVKYFATKAIDGLGGKQIAAFFESLRNLGQERLKNFSEILEATVKKATLLDKEFRGEISPRVAERLFNEGSYCAESIMQEYYAGVLLSNDGGFVDDEGVFYLSTIHRLSSMQLKAHYVLYYIIRRINKGRGSSILGGTEAKSGPVPIPGLTYVKASVLLTAIYGQNPVSEANQQPMKTKQSDYQYYTDQLIQGLKKENLVRCFFAATDQDTLGKENDLYFFFAPNLEGIQLYLWGQGYGKRRVDDFLSDELLFPPLESFQLEKQLHTDLYGTYNQYATHGMPAFNKQFIFEQVKQKFDR